MTDNARLPFPAYHGEDPYVFISYAHKDARRVYPVLTRFHHAGANVWYDEGITAGSRWREELAKRINSSSGFIFFLSDSSVASQVCWSEINFALDRGVPFLTIRLSDAPLPLGLRLAISDRQAVDVFGPGENGGIEQALDWLRNLLDLGTHPTELRAPFPRAILDAFQIHGVLEGSDRSFRAFDVERNRWVVLTSINDPSVPDWREVVKRLETRRRIVHRSLPLLHEMHSFGTTLVVVTEYVQGQRFSDVVDQVPQIFGKDHWYLFRRIAAQLIDALNVLHRNSLTHGAVSAGRVRLRFDGGAVLVGGEPIQTSQDAAPDRRGLAVLLRDCAGCAAERLGPTDPIPGIAETVLHLLEAGEEVGDHLLSKLSPDSRSTRPRKDEMVKPFVGREHEMGTLMAGFHALDFSAPGVIVVSGSSGVGKTELMQRFLANLGDNVLIFSDRCYAGNQGTFNAFQEVARQIREFLQTSPSKSLLMPRNLRALEAVFPALENLSEESGPTGKEPLNALRGKETAYLALKDLIGRIAEQQRLVLWVDDFQWSDTESRQLLKEILSGVDAPAILCLLSMRPEDVPVNELNSVIDGASWTETLALQPLNDTDATQLIHELSDDQLPPKTISTIVSDTMGSPFLIEVAIDHVDVGKVSDLDFDPTRVIDDWIMSLDPRELRIVELVAVAEAPIRLTTLNWLLGGHGVLPLIEDLADHRVLRRAIAGGEAATELYHQRIESAILSSLTDERLRELHWKLFEAMEALDSPDHAVLATHLLKSGNPRKAVPYLLKGAEDASNHLAFANAATLYSQALEVRDEDSHVIIPLLAEALVRSGRPSEGADKYLVAAPLAESNDDRIRYMEAAAFNYMVSGHFEQGVRLFRPVLKHHHVYFPKTTAGALRGFLRIARWLNSRGLVYDEVGRDENSHRQWFMEERQQVMDMIARSLFVTDNVRGAYFAALALGLALKLGGHQRVMQALDLANSTGLLELAGPKVAQQGTRLLDAELTMAESKGDAEFLGRSMINRAQKSLALGQWASVRSQCTQGLDALSSTMKSHIWESNTGNMLLLRALSELGELQDHYAHCAQFAREAERRGDFYAIATGKLNEAYNLLARDEPTESRTIAEEVRRMWSGTTVAQHQLLYIDRLLIMCDIYDDRIASAEDRLEQLWPKLSRSKQLAIPMVRADAALLSIRVAFNRAIAGGKPAAVERELASLSRVARPDVEGFVAYVEAFESASAGDLDSAVNSLESAAEIFKRMAMAIAHQCMRVRLGQLRNDNAGSEQVRMAQSHLAAQGIGRPDRWLDLMFPMPAHNASSTSAVQPI